jgi:hypothetical protein
LLNKSTNIKNRQKMKKIAFILSMILCLAASVHGQRTITDTLQGAETVNFSAMAGLKTAQVTFTQLGGTSDGTMNLQASNDGTSYASVVATDQIRFVGNDTLTITAASVWLVSNEEQYPYYRFTGTGTASDTTLVTIKWSK